MKHPNPTFRLRIVRILFSTCVLSFAGAHSALAGSATWDLNPTSNDWNTAVNWTPDTVPNGPADTATFAVSNTPAVSLATNAEVNSIVFNPGASPFVISVFGQGTVTSTLTISGAGVVNNSGIMQQLVAGLGGASGGLGQITFSGNATIGSLITIANQGGAPNETGVTLTTFTDNASAGAATIVNGGAINGSHGEPGQTKFMGNATAATSTFICQSGSGGGHFGAFGGSVRFENSSTAASATFQLEGGTVTDATGGYAAFYDTSSAGNSVFTVGGSDVGGSSSLHFYDSSSAGNATLIVNGGLDFYGSSTGGTARVELFGNGSLTTLFGIAPAIGSIEGDGIVSLGESSPLTIGTNNLSTTFSGLIQNHYVSVAGSLAKTGIGTLTLSGANTYTGDTTVNQGTLVINNQSGSGTGTGSVQVTGGTLGGSGTITGAVTVGTGSGTGSFLAPAAGITVQTRLTIEDALILNSDATYTYTFKANSKHARTDLVIANGVTINGATLTINATTQGRMKRGLVLNVISNTSANPISGTFANLADRAIVNVNGNNLQASYSGGDGNDLTLTVVP